MQAANQTEAQQLKAALEQIEGKLDRLLRQRRDALLASLDSAETVMLETQAGREHGADPHTLWDRVHHVAGDIVKVQNAGLRELGALIETAEGSSTARAAKKALGEVEREIAVQLAIVGRCFELSTLFDSLEIDHVLDTSPTRLDGHLAAVHDRRLRRRQALEVATGHLLERLCATGATAQEHVILHAQAARKAVASLNGIQSQVDGLHAALGLEARGQAAEAVGWRQAWRDPRQREVAGTEAKKVGSGIGVGVATLAAVAVGRSRADR